MGVGSGRFAAPLGIQFGVEPSEKMAAKAEKRGIRVFRGVAENLPFFDSEFDLVLMVTTICFVDDVLKSFTEAFRVLKPGGFIIVGFIDRESELVIQYDNRRKTSVFYKDARFFSAQEVFKYLTDAGFADLEFRQTVISGEAPEVILNGFGKGAFVAVKVVKSNG